jgi:hypothetical protein
MATTTTESLCIRALQDISAFESISFHNVTSFIACFLSNKPTFSGHLPVRFSNFFETIAKRYRGHFQSILNWLRRY